MLDVPKYVHCESGSRTESGTRNEKPRPLLSANNKKSDCSDFNKTCRLDIFKYIDCESGSGTESGTGTENPRPLLSESSRKN